MKISWNAKFTLMVIFLCMFCVVSAFLLINPLGFYLGGMLTCFLTLPIVIFSIQQFFSAFNQQVSALLTGLEILKDNDFSHQLVVYGNNELSQATHLFNEAVNSLRVTRQSLYQRELLLDTVLQSSAQAVVLANKKQQIIYSNPSACQLLHQGKLINGLDFYEVVKQLSPDMFKGIQQQQSGLYELEIQNEKQVVHLTQAKLTLHSQNHFLYLFKQVTRELAREESSAFKKVIRLISHEMNNTLAPISSLAHSGRLICKENESIQAIFETIEESALHLKNFIETYVTFARLPLPLKEEVHWETFINSLALQISFTAKNASQRSLGYFDSAQMQQVMLNLLKNAHESSSSPDSIEVELKNENEFDCLLIKDRGVGMSEKILKNALLPFYSTKKQGTGLGLALCKEIIDAHQGFISLQNREEGGLVVILRIPCYQH